MAAKWHPETRFPFGLVRPLLLGLCLILGPAAESRAEEGPGDPEEAFLEHVLQEWSGDFDGMIERGFVRLLTVYNPVSFTYDGKEQKGLALELARELDQSKRSHVGAIGVMQVMPTTAADSNVAIEGIERTEPNVHAGVKYLRFLKDRYFSGPEISVLDQTLLSFAAYNAGPGAIAKARAKAEKMGLDPNRWFGHVEIAAARTISREPVVYVRNIYKYYVAYDRIAAIGREKPELTE